MGTVCSKKMRKSGLTDAVCSKAVLSYQNPYLIMHILMMLVTINFNCVGKFLTYLVSKNIFRVRPVLLVGLHHTKVEKAYIIIARHTGSSF